jgi:F-type H+-transporting ATPase subunit gamma
MLPYETMLEHILKSFLAAEAEAQTIYDQERPVKRVALVIFSSNSSLCGGFNANIIKLMQHTVEGLSEEIGVENIDIYPIGRKVAEKAQKLGYNVMGNFSNMVDHPNVHQCIEIAMDLGRRFADGEIDKVELIYHHFKSAGSQILTSKTFLPIDIESELERDHERDLTTNMVTKKTQDYLKKNSRKKEYRENETKPLNDNFIVEPDMNTVLSQLMPKMAHLMLYTALLDSVASEHAARMVAMQTATDNADELLRQLNLQYNKSRQQAITSELLDIVGGSVNN